MSEDYYCAVVCIYIFLFQKFSYRDSNIRLMTT